MWAELLSPGGGVAVLATRHVMAQVQVQVMSSWGTFAGIWWDAVVDRGLGCGGVGVWSGTCEMTVSASTELCLKNSS